MSIAEIDATGLEVINVPTAESQGEGLICYTHVGQLHSQVTVIAQDDSIRVRLLCTNIRSLRFEGSFRAVELYFDDQRAIDLSNLQTNVLIADCCTIDNAVELSVKKFSPSRCVVAKGCGFDVETLLLSGGESEGLIGLRVDGRLTAQQTVINDTSAFTEVNGQFDVGRITSYADDRTTLRSLHINTRNTAGQVTVRGVDTRTCIRASCQVVTFNRVHATGFVENPLTLLGTSVFQFLNATVNGCELGNLGQPAKVRTLGNTELSNAWGYLEDLEMQPGDILAGRRWKGPLLSIGTVSAVDHAELRNVDLSSCTFQSLEKLRSAERVVPHLPVTAGYSVRLCVRDFVDSVRPLALFWTLFNRDEARCPPSRNRFISAIRRARFAYTHGEFWVLPRQQRTDRRNAEAHRWDRIRIVGEDTRAFGHTQSEIRFFYKQARRRSAGASTERLLLTFDGLFGYGERVLQPLGIFFVVCLGVAWLDASSMERHISVLGFNMHSYWSRVKYLGESPLSTIRIIDDARYKPSVGSVGVITVVRLVGVLLTAMSIVAAKRLLDPLKK